MVRFLHILGLGALFSAGGILALSVSLWRQDDPQREEIRHRPSVIEVFQRGDSRAGTRLEERPPLIVQAEAFAQYLDPPKGPEKLPALALTRSSKPAGPPIRPMISSVSFKLRATSYYPHQPDRSMALVSEAGSAEGSERWVREGSRLGHFVVREIRRGSITYRDGDNLREMLVEPGTSLPSIVRDIRPGTRQVSAAVGGGHVRPSAAVDTNSIEIGGHH